MDFQVFLNLNPVIQCVSHQYSQLCFFPLKARLYRALPKQWEGEQTTGLLGCWLPYRGGSEPVPYMW